MVTIGEIKAGVEKLVDSPKKERILHWLDNDLLRRFEGRIIDIDVAVMLQWGIINAQLKKIGKPLPIMDSLIGATVQVNNMVLLTRNEKDFQHLAIKIINPFH